MSPTFAQPSGWRSRRKRWALRRIADSHFKWKPQEQWQPGGLPRWGALLVLPVLVGLALSFFSDVAGPETLSELLRGAVGAIALASVLLLGLPAFLAGTGIPVFRPPDVRVQVLYQSREPWEVGQGGPDHRPGQHYPRCFDGRVISVVEPEHKWRPGDRKDPNRRVVTLDLPPADVADLRSGRLKMAGEGYLAAPVPTTLEDRHGAVLPELLAKYGSLVAIEQKEFEASVEREEAALDPDTPHEAHEFELEVVRLRKALPHTVTHSGAGLYEVGPTKTYSTIQSALDQLWTDQGSAAFTASQHIRVFAGTYDENVTPNAGFNPVENQGYWLHLEGDPDDSRDNIIIAPSGGSYAIDTNCDMLAISHLTVAGTPTTAMINGGSGCFYTRHDDCVISGDKPFYRTATHSRQALYFDCAVTCTANVAGITNRINLYAFRSSFTGPGKATSTIALGISRFLFEFKSCDISGWDYALRLDQYSNEEYAVVKNCNIYDCRIGVSFTMSHRIGTNMRIWNSVFKDVTYPYYTQFSAWPEITDQRTTPQFLQRNNCYHNYTAFAFKLAGGTKTYAEWIALSGVDASGELDDTDPLFTTPGSDFTLQAGSPCEHAGAGAGVVTDIDGTAFDPYYPDMGAHSSGTADAPGVPTISSAVDDETGTSATVTLVAANALDELFVYYQKSGDTSWTLFGTTRTGSGTLQVTGLTADTVYEFAAVAARLGSVSRRPSPWSIPKSARVTDGSTKGRWQLELRQALVSLLEGSSPLSTLLGTDSNGDKPIYQAGSAGVFANNRSVAYQLLDDPGFVLSGAHEHSPAVDLTVTVRPTEASPPQDVLDDVMGTLDYLLMDWRPSLASATVLRCTPDGMVGEGTDNRGFVTRTHRWRLALVKDD